MLHQQQQQQQLHQLQQPQVSMLHDSFSMLSSSSTMHFPSFDHSFVEQAVDNLLCVSMEMESPLITDSPFLSSLADSGSSFNSIMSPSQGLTDPSPTLSITQDQNEAWCPIPIPFQQQLCTHYMLFLDQVQHLLQVSDCPPPMDISPTISPWNEKRKAPSYSFIDNERTKKVRRELVYSSTPSPILPSSTPNSPRSPMSSPSTSSSCSSPTFYQTEYTPNQSLFGLKELAAMLPSVSQMEEAVQAGITSPTATQTMIELSKRPELLALKQSDAARIMGISTSVLSKRWREVTKGKKWPHRIHHKLKRIEN